ncbi:M14 family metallopeptidase [Plastoroseomonas arctica]|uniref:Peptidase M14 n=1 Tax=Plastoroseomonas arctica TaxID=1509237 RepID=A0AAF1K5B7_9PROT|nr:succinylglutamate desuccinylase/aspartoacylase family protein [Plastoroseomonas arctica]MBR0656898.1 peptidase M14 [Plastoroseomonas arctica]
MPLDREVPTPTPRFPVNLAAPDLTRWRIGNTGIAGVHSFAADAAGPHLLVTALIHGNEIAGAILLDRLLRATLTPRRGRITLALANLDAFARFQPEDPTASRFIDEDMNRVWEEHVLDGSGRTAELRRARELRPVVDQADVVLDLHSMLWPSDPLILTGRSAQAAALGVAIGLPPTVVADDGHTGGRRLIDYHRLAEPAPGRGALLVEAGQHWEAATVATMEGCFRQLAGRLGLLAPVAALPPGRLAHVTRTVTAQTDNFAFLRDYRGGEVIAERNTLIALDGEAEIRTPHDDCLLVMPSPRTLRGHTAVRLAQFD